MRRGISLIKLLVIIAIIAILIGLLLPTVQKVREAANRTRSQNNLKQMAIAIHNYHSVNNRFPTLCDFGDGSVTGSGYASLHFQILPYLEQDAVYKLFDAKNPSTYCDKDAGAARLIIRTYMNPADPSAPDGFITTAEFAKGGKATKGTYATTSYPVSGLVFQPGTGFKDITDGTSNTIMIAERYQVCKMGSGTEMAKATGPDVYCLWGIGAYGASTAAFALPTVPEGAPIAKPAHAQFSPNSPVPLQGAIAGTSNAAAIKDYDAFRLAAVPTAPAGFQVAPRGQAICDARVPQSPHTGGMSVAFSDGSVRMLNGNLSPHFFWAMVTPAGGEQIGAP